MYESIEDVQAATRATNIRAVALGVAIEETGHNTNHYGYLAACACQVEGELENGDRDLNGYLLNVDRHQTMTYTYNKSAAYKAVAIQKALEEVGSGASPRDIAGRAVNIERALTEAETVDDGLAEFLPCLADTTYASRRQETNNEEDFHSCMTYDDNEVTYQHPRSLLATMKVK